MEWNEKAIVMDVRSLHHQTRPPRSARPVLLDSPLPAFVANRPRGQQKYPHMQIYFI